MHMNRVSMRIKKVDVNFNVKFVMFTLLSYSSPASTDNLMNNNHGKNNSLRITITRTISGVVTFLSSPVEGRYSQS